MPRSDEAEAFFYGVYAAIQEIPYGRVTTYGHIAYLVGTRELSTTTSVKEYTADDSRQLSGRARWESV